MTEGTRPGIFINAKKTATAAPASQASPIASPPKDVKRRWMYIAAGVVGLVVISTSFTAKEAPKAAAAKPVGMIDTTPPTATKDAFEAAYAKKLEAQASTIRDLQKQMATMQRSGGETPSEKALPPSLVPPPTATGNGSAIAPVTAPPPPPKLDLPVPSIEVKKGNTPQLPPIGDAPLLKPVSEVAPAGPLSFEAPATSSSSESSSGSSKDNAVVAKNKWEKNPNAGLLPAGAFAAVSLLTGLDAGTSAATQANPMPVLMRVTEQATLPGSAKYKLKNCFVLGTGYGDQSAERVYIRFSRLSCIDKADKLVLSQDVQGYLVDSDGKLGLRGIVVDRQGAKLRSALLAGFAQVMAGALSSSQGSVTSNATTGTTATTITGAAALRASGLSGAQSAVSQIAEFYLKEAQSIFPVITIDTGRVGSIVFTNSVALAWNSGESQFVSQITPANNPNSN